MYFVSSSGTSKILIGCTIGLESFEFFVFNADCFEFKYKSECRCCCVSLSVTIYTATVASTTTVIFYSIGTRSSQISRIGCNLIGVFSPTIIESTRPIKYEIENLRIPQSSTQRRLNFNPNGARSREFEDAECIFGVRSITSEFNCDINNVFKYWVSMLAFDFFDFFFFLARIGQEKWKCQETIRMFVIPSFFFGSDIFFF